MMMNITSSPNETKLFVTKPLYKSVKSPFERITQVYTSLKEGKGVKKIKEHLWVYALKVFVILLCIIGCGWQVIPFAMKYFEYPTIVHVHLEKMNKLHLPGLTICNSNR